MENDVFTLLQLFASIFGAFVPVWIAAAALAINRRSSRLIKQAYHEFFVVDRRNRAWNERKW